MRSFLILASILSVFASAAFAAPTGTPRLTQTGERHTLTDWNFNLHFTEPRAAGPAPAEPVEARQGDEDDGVGWFVAVPALMKPGPVDLTINVPIPGIPCDKKKS